ncbi:LPS export ABC transporter permease LptG [Pontibacter sp. JAM-7]|uniref:LPS export ABC transporter permease LptG n=1 Tax=Pontibacter sp. JAM-7 TaxID=3366581 RepID=UPI003AF494C0
MTVLDRYIAKQVLAAFGVTLLVILGLDLLFATLEELTDLAGKYTFWPAVNYVLMTLPRRIYDFVPLASLIGCLLGLGMLASSSELTVMRAAGLSTWRIIIAVFQPVLVLILATMLLGELAVPQSEQHAQSYRQLKLSGSEVVREASRVWHRDQMTFVQINAVIPGGRIRGVTRYEFNQDLGLKRASYAKQGEYRDGQWYLTGVKSTLFPDTMDASVPALQTDVQAVEVWPSQLTPELLSAVTVDPDTLSMTQLSRYVDYLLSQGLASENYRVAYWGKLLMPLEVLALVLIAVSFVFGPLRSVTLGQRLMTGVIVGLTFKLSRDLLEPASAVYGIAPLLAVLLPILICLAAGTWLLRRAH